MKPIRFFVYGRSPLIPVEKCVSGYPPEEQAKFREEFRPIAEKYRRTNRFSTIGFIAGWLGIMTLILFSFRTKIPWALIPFILGVGFFIRVLSRIPCLICPACGNQLDGCLGRFCPECGSDHFMRRSWGEPSYCPDCKKWVGGMNRTRQYDIHACTHCGVFLDEKGV
jgi:hypothetical protein